MRSRLIVLPASTVVPTIAAPALADGHNAESDLRTYEVTLSDRTSGQPISPPVFVIHDRSVRFWQRGAGTSAGIIAIAEDGDPSVAVGMLESMEGAPTSAD